MNANTPLWQLTVGEFTDLVNGIVGERVAEVPQEPPENATEYVYGIGGIASLFGVSKTTAQSYKNTFLQPAILQRGRNIMINKKEAIELYEKELKQ